MACMYVLWLICTFSRSYVRLVASTRSWLFVTVEHLLGYESVYWWPESASVYVLLLVCISSSLCVHLETFVYVLCFVSMSGDWFILPTT